MPPPPPRFSTTTLCLNAVDRCSARMRAQMSAAPPGAKMPTMLIVFAGQMSARAGAATVTTDNSSPAIQARPRMLASRPLTFAAHIRCLLGRFHADRLRGLGDTLPRALGDGNARGLTLGVDSVAARG